MTKGRGRISTENETVDISEGDIFFIPNGERYHSYWYGDPEVEFISLKFIFFPDFDGRRYPTQTICGYEDAVGIIKSIASRDKANAESVGELYTLIARLLPKMSFSPKNSQNALVDKAKRCVLESPNLSVREIARACAVSESKLYAAFANFSDTSINSFKKGALMEKARELLTSSDLSIEEIARKLNFSSGAYFRKCFKEYYNASPREMRKMGGI
jgi:AraC-like DNA-binding protein